MPPNDPFAPLQLFSFPLFATMIGGHEEHRQGLLDEIAAQRRADPGLVRSNRGGWHSGEAFLASRNVHIGWVLDSVTTFARRALAPYYGGFKDKEVRLGHYWANVLGPGDYNAPHHHHPQHWSGVYYVAVPPSGGEGDQGGTIEFLNPSPAQSHWGSGSFATAPRDGTTLLFPSSLVHLVHPHKAEGDRVSIAYNLNIGDRR